MSVADEKVSNADSDQDDLFNIANDTLSATVSIGSLAHAFDLQIATSTDVDLCGLQAWPCSILLIDWLVYEFGLAGLQRCSIMELGAGPGLVAVALGPYTARYVASDADAAVLDLCRRNLARNRSPASVVEFDLRRPSQLLSSFRADLVIAADLIYDDDLTLALAAAFAEYLPGSSDSCCPRRVIIANESRLNFLIDRLAIGDASMDFFFDAIRQIGLRAVPIDCSDIPSSSDLARSTTSMLFEIVMDKSD